MKQLDMNPPPVVATIQDVHVPMAAPASMLETVIRAVANPQIDPERLRQFLEIGRLLEADQAKREYVLAFQAAKLEINEITIKKNGMIVYKKEGKEARIAFAKYDDISSVVKPILARHSLAASYDYEYISNPAKVICVMTLTHARGHSEKFRSVPLPMVDSSGGKNDVQGAGSVSSYGRRYTVCPAFDIVAEGEDDDGSGKGTPEKITEKQLVKIEDILQAQEERLPGNRERVMRWIKAEHKIDKLSELYQGMQLQSVMLMLSAKSEGLGIK